VVVSVRGEGGAANDEAQAPLCTETAVGMLRSEGAPEKLSPQTLLSTVTAG
jgi:hypothetical protein